MRRTLQRAGAALLIVAALFVGLTVATANTADPALYPPRAGEPSVTVYVLYNTLHSNIAVERSRLTAQPGAAREAVGRLAPSPWVWVGWGDFKFYQETGWSDRRKVDFLRALFKPGNPSVTHLAGVQTPTIDPEHPSVVRLRLSPAGFERMRQRIERSLSVDAAGHPEVVGPGHAPNALFFRSPETFSFAHLCNHWTAQVLKTAGVPTTPVIDTVSTGLGFDLVRRAGGTPVAGSHGQAGPAGLETRPS